MGNSRECKAFENFRWMDDTFYKNGFVVIKQESNLNSINEITMRINL
ncbi:MAG: hypothetical protein HFF01_06980 [Erysipelotrichaceae bacterium]|nr:hypothetical protein [Erysipelotrichaceae bacterium]